MAKSNVAVFGSNRLAEEMLALCREKGVAATPLRDPAALATTTNAVIDTESGDEDRKRALLQQLDATLPPSSLMITSCLRFGTTHMAAWLRNPERVVG